MNNTRPLIVALAALAALAAWPATGAAQGQGSAADARPTVLHTPPVSWAAGGDVRLVAHVSADWKLEAIQARVRPLGSAGAFTPVSFARAPDNTFVAVIPAKDAQPPGIEYYIESVSTTGETAAHFATPQAPHPLAVVGETDETRQRERLLRHRGHRSAFELRGELTAYGPHQTSDPLDELVTTDDGSDWYWVGEAEYTWRRLGLLYDIFFGVGFMRGQRATVTEGGVAVPVGVDLDSPAPGLNYGYGGATLELHRNFSLSGHLILGASEEGFAAGGGALLRIGRIAGTRFEVGGELVQDAGNRGFMRFAWDTVPRVPMALTVEVDGWPDGGANPSGTRLYLDAGYEITDQLTVAGRVGRATRANAVDAGLMGGLMTKVEF